MVLNQERAMIPRKIDFNHLQWQVPATGVRHKILVIGDIRFRLVEYSVEMPLHWCERGHRGYLLDGDMQIEYVDETIVYRRGDGIHIPDGAEHRHRATVLTTTATAFFLESA
jgi:hypothetical protein